MLQLQSYLVGILTVLISFYAIYTWKRRRLYKLANKIPGPNGLPFFGEALSVLGSDHSKAFRSLTNLAKDYETPSKIWYGPYCAIILDNPKDLQIVLNSPKSSDKAEVYKFIGLEKGLVVSGGNIWKNHRKLLDPAFHVKVLQSFMPVFNEKAKVLMRQFDQRVGEKEFDCFTQISACTLENLLSTMFGIEQDVQSNAFNNKYLHDIEQGTKFMNDRLFKVWFHFKPFFRLSPTYKFYEKYVINGVFAIADEILKKKAEKPKVENSTKHKIFIDQLLSAEKSLAKDEVVDEINTLIGAGHETSSLIISAALVMLAMHKDVQEKLYEEVQNVMNDLGEEITENHLHKLNYLEMVIKETLRLFPVLPIHARIASEDIELEKYTIPAGANIVISVFNTHRKVENWGEDADNFKPERFLPENFEKLHPYAFIPFSKGPRICIGWRYSMMFMKSTMAYLVRNYKFDTSLKYEDLKFEIALTMKIAQKYKISITKRNHQD